MKNMTYDEKVLKCAKILVKEFKNGKGDGNCIDILGRISTVIQNNVSDIVFDSDSWNSKGANISFGNLNDEETARVTCNIANKVMEIIKLPKRVRVFKDERKKTELRGFMLPREYNYYYANKIVIVTPCKEFNNINKKLTHLGCNAISFEKWWRGSVFGKRSDYSITKKHYYATDKVVCDKVLAYLKGKKKVSYKIVRDEDFAEREYGEIYETEWSGSLAYRIQFTDSSGKDTTIY